MTMNVTRRSVFGGAAAVVAATAAPVAMAAVGDAGRKRLADRLAGGGVIENEHFEFFDGKPVMLGGTGRFELRNCRFTWHGKKPAGYLGFTRQNTGEVANCVFEHASGAARPMIIRKI